MFTENYSLNQELEQQQQHFLAIEDQNQSLVSENKRLQEQNALAKDHVREMEVLITSLREEIGEKNLILEEYERTLNDSR